MRIDVLLTLLIFAAILAGCAGPAWLN